MDTFLMSSFSINVYAGIIVAIIVAGTSFGYGLFIQNKRYKKARKTAIEKISKRISEILHKESLHPVERAESIVSACSHAKLSISNLGRLLNSDIDMLGAFVSEVVVIRAEGREIPNRMVDQINQRLSVIKNTWPLKEDLIEIEIEKLLSELGIVEI
ncbi:hypothetical protein [Magnetospirillum sulfuroxidans]|uniref:DUF2489 domain-containing protein n=1 Tax=Magnetospirillum sulfuroxidans TaxID=611300 RepID=A0ABS5I8X6_9PROT|nr:hypothetical protein [Magnetospirillum sulfuroxidans]MBR9970888.1 hypothetical protein [Magnetospirillum sulfuroxidans]